MRIRIANGTIITAADTQIADLWIEDDRVVALCAPGVDALGTPDRTFDATLRYVIPGGIDAHTHLDMPVDDEVTSADDFESGTIAAAFGGTTTVIDYATQERGGGLSSALEAWHARAEGKAAIDYGFHMALTDVPPHVLEEMGTMVDAGVTSFKMYMAYPDRLYLDDEAIFRAMLRASELGATVCMHAEIGLPIDVLVERARAVGLTTPIHHALTRPEAAEATGTERAIALAEMARAKVYIVHLSCARALARVREARDTGQRVWAETCPQYLFLSEDDLRARPDDPFAGARYVCTPPLRPREHHHALWQGIASHDLDVVATDHCPFCYQGQKDRGRDDFSRIPNGLPGIETRLHLLYEAVTQNKLSMERFVDVSATTPARLFGLYPQKGTIAVGSDADIVIWDPNRPMTLDAENLHMHVDYAAYPGHRVPGSPSHVFSRGELIVEEGRWLGEPGRGRFLKRRAQ